MHSHLRSLALLIAFSALVFAATDCGPHPLSIIPIEAAIFVAWVICNANQDLKHIANYVSLLGGLVLLYYLVIFAPEWGRLQINEFELARLMGDFWFVVLPVLITVQLAVSVLLYTLGVFITSKTETFEELARRAAMLGLTYIFLFVLWAILTWPFCLLT